MDPIQQEMNAMQACAETLRPLPDVSRARVITYLADLFGRRSSSPPSKLREALTSPAFKEQSSHQAKYLWIVRFLFRQYPDASEFLSIACSLKGDSRSYFAENPRAIEESGKGAKGVRLAANSPLWADVNNSTDTKRRILGDLMTRLGCGQDDIELAQGAI